MYDFLKRPLWILSHVLVVIAVVAMVALGFWQKSRWDLRKSQSDAIEQKANDRAVPFASLVPDDATTFPVENEYRRVLVVGTYSVADEVVVRNRSQGGAPGAWVLTPIVPKSGPAVAVVRGWVPLSVAEKGPGQRIAAPPKKPAEKRRRNLRNRRKGHQPYGGQRRRTRRPEIRIACEDDQDDRNAPDRKNQPAQIAGCAAHILRGSREGRPPTQDYRHDEIVRDHGAQRNALNNHHRRCRR